MGTGLCRAQSLFLRAAHKQQFLEKQGKDKTCDNFSITIRKRGDNNEV